MKELFIGSTIGVVLAMAVVLTFQKEKSAPAAATHCDAIRIQPTFAGNKIPSLKDYLKTVMTEKEFFETVGRYATGERRITCDDIHVRFQGRDYIYTFKEYYKFVYE